MKKCFIFGFAIAVLVLLDLAYPQVSIAQNRYVYLYSWPEGPGFDSPYDLAVDGSGNIYVADTNNHRIQKFNRFGDLSTSWGIWGSGEGQFQNPWSVAVDKSGNVYVVDETNCNIQKFSSNGGYITTYGKRGTRDGEFVRPNGVAVDHLGNIYVADTDNHRIQKLGSNGSFITKWGSNGTGDGQTPYPEGIAVDSQGNVYLADAWNGRIQKFDSNGNFLKKWGKQGNADGDFIGPRGVAIDPSGNVYVADTRNNRIQKFDSEGNFLEKWGTLGAGDGQFYSPRAIDISPFGDICVSDWGNNRIQVLDPSGNFFARWGISGNGNGQFLGPRGVALDSNGNIYVADRDNHRIQKLDRNGNFLAKWGSRGAGDGQFIFPSGITVDRFGNIYVSDLGNNRIQKFDSLGNFLGKWGSVGIGDGQFMSPFGVACDFSGNVYVADWNNHRIQKFDPTGRFLTKWGKQSGADGDFSSPMAIAIDLNGSVYVADTNNYRIQKFTSDGAFLGKWGTRGSGDGQLHTPKGIAVDAGGNVYVSEYGNYRIQKFNSSGVSVAKFGHEGNPMGLVRYQYGLAVDSTGSTVYVADSGNQCIKVYVLASGNIPPIANPKMLIGFEDTPISFTLTGRDPDGGTPYFRIGNLPKNGQLTGNLPNLTYTPFANFFGNDSFTFIASDGMADSNPATVLITIGPINDDPTADSKKLETDEDKPLDITLTGKDPDGDNLTFSIIDSPQNGTLSGTSPNFVYTPKTDFNGTDSLTYMANDGNPDGNSDKALIEITIKPVNDPPSADSAEVKVDEDSFAQITLTGKDPEENPVTFTITSQTTKGKLTGTPPNVIYTPEANYFGPDSFTFTTNDGLLDSQTATISITVNPVNDKPIAESKEYKTQEDTFIRITLTADDSIDSQIQTLGFAIVDKPSHGKLSGTPPYVIYTPDTNYFGTDSFTFTAQDAFEKSDPATITIVVEPVNDRPMANSQPINTKEDIAIKITLTGSDPDNTELIYKVLTKPSNGNLIGTEPNLEYVPNPNFYGDDSFTFNVNDGLVDSNNVGTIAIKVESVNDAPTAKSDEYKTKEDTTINITLSGSDVEFDPITFIIIKYPDNGFLGGDGTDRQYKPNFGFFGTDSFTFKVNDGKVDSEIATITIVVEKINDEPFANSQSKTTEEDKPIDIILTGTDPDNDKLTFSIVNPPKKGTLEGTPPNVTYIPNKDVFGDDSFAFIVNDGTIDSKPATVNITITPVNDPPIAKSQDTSLDEDSQVNITISATDPENDKLSYEIVNKVSYGTLDGTPPNLIYKPNKDFFGDDSFTFTASDGKLKSNIGSVNIKVNPVNDKPVAESQSLQTDEDTSLSITLKGTDIDGDTLTYKIIDQPSNGTIEGSLPNAVYKPKDNYNGDDSFTFIVNDGKLDSAIAKIDIKVNPVNDKPVAESQSLQTDEDTPLSITLKGTDIDGDTLTYKIIDQPSNGTISGTASELVYQAKYGFSGADSFTFVINDGTTDSDKAVIKIDIVEHKNKVDINGDGFINILDLVAVNINYGREYGKDNFPKNYNPDVNRDGKVDSDDVNAILKNFGKKYE